MIKKNKIIKLTSATYLKDFKLRLIFNDGVSQTIDFKFFLDSSSNPDIKKFLNLKKFKNFSFENGELMWGDFELIFPIIDLYENNIMKSSSGKKERRVS